MKNSKYHKKGSQSIGQIVGSSVKSSLIRFREDKCFRVCMIILLIFILMYNCIWDADKYVSNLFVITNTKEFSSDVSIDKVSYINENGRIFLDNGKSVDEAENYTVLLYGNDFWYSYRTDTLAVPLTKEETISRIVLFYSVSVSLWVLIFSILCLLNSKKVCKIFAIILCIILCLDMIAMVSVTNLVSNVELAYITLIIVSIMVSIGKAFATFKCLDYIETRV